MYGKNLDILGIFFIALDGSHTKSSTFFLVVYLYLLSLKHIWMVIKSTKILAYLGLFTFQVTRLELGL